MDEKFLSWLGLGITRRTCVTNWNCTPPSQEERCGKSFIFNRVSCLGTYFCVLRRPSDPIQCLASNPPPCKVARKKPGASNRFIGGGSILTSKTCPNPSPASQEQNMSEPAVITPTLTIARPQAGEYAPYYDRYISLVQGEDILNTLDQQRRETMTLLCGRDEEDGDFRYAPGKWSAKEVLGHVCDSERVFAYRALRIARADATPLAGFEQADYVRNGPFAQRPLADLVEDFI